MSAFVTLPGYLTEYIDGCDICSLQPSLLPMSFKAVLRTLIPLMVSRSLH